VRHKLERNLRPDGRTNNLEAKLDAAGHSDDFEVDRVVAVELRPNAGEAIRPRAPLIAALMVRGKVFWDRSG
jgi:type I restriction enzyme R subunit